MPMSTIDLEVGKSWTQEEQLERLGHDLGVFVTHFGIEVIESNHLVVREPIYITRYFKRGARRGQQKGPKKYYLGHKEKPDLAIFIIESPPRIICHPVVARKLRRLAWSGRGAQPIQADVSRVVIGHS